MTASYGTGGLWFALLIREDGGVWRARERARALPAAAGRLLRRWRERLQRFGGEYDAPLREGCVVALYPDGDDILAACRLLIARARRSIDVEMYIWADDEVGRGLVEDLLEAMSRGVRVRALYDAVGCFEGTKHLELLGAGGASVAAFHPIAPWRMRGNPNRRNHRKLLLVDDSVAIVGSANWSLDYDEAVNARAFRDVGVGLAGPVVDDLAADFRRVWLAATGEALPAPEGRLSDLTPPGEVIRELPAQLVSGLRPWERGAIRRLYGLILGSAGREILIANAYFVPSRRIVRLLTRAARRGVEVDVVVPGLTDSPWVQAAGRATYARLLSGGVRVHERQSRMLHAKVALVDGQVSVVGSANLDARSFRHNLELSVNIHDASFGELLREALSEEVRASVAVDPVTWSRRPFLERARQQAAYLVRYWL